MEQNVNQNDNRQPCFRKVIGNTTYMVQVHFSETARETLGRKIKRMIADEASTAYAQGVVKDSHSRGA